MRADPDSPGSPGSAATMRASVLVEPGRIEVEERPAPVPAADEVLVRVRSVGVCGSDVHYYREGRIGPFVVERPLVLGHEVSGVVADVGADVPRGRIGQRVAVEPQRPCRRCRQCTAGRLNLCPDMQFLATPPVDGAFCDFVTVPAELAHPVPDAVSDHAAALLEPLSVAVAACRKARVAPGDTVLVTGAGPVGVLSVLAARVFGAARVVVTDVHAGRRERALAAGADAVHDPRAAEFAPEELDADAFVECSGAPSAVDAGLHALRGGGRAVLVGSGPAVLPVPVQTVVTRELVVTGVFRYVDTWPTAIALAQRGDVDLDALVTGEHPLEEAEAALVSVGEPGTMKPVVVVSTS